MNLTAVVWKTRLYVNSLDSLEMDLSSINPHLRRSLTRDLGTVRAGFYFGNFLIPLTQQVGFRVILVEVRYIAGFYYSSIIP